MSTRSTRYARRGHQQNPRGLLFCSCSRCEHWFFHCCYYQGKAFVLWTRSMQMAECWWEIYSQNQRFYRVIGPKKMRTVYMVSFQSTNVLLFVCGFWEMRKNRGVTHLDCFVYSMLMQADARALVNKELKINELVRWCNQLQSRYHTRQ